MLPLLPSETHAPASPLPSPAAMQSSIPAAGVQVLAGHLKNPTQLACLLPGKDDETTSLANFKRKSIAAQCCTVSGGCRRSIAGTGCIAGRSARPAPYIKTMTFAENAAECISLGLQLCSQSCAGTGCNYNEHPVYSRLSCDLPPRGIGDTPPPMLPRPAVQHQSPLAPLEACTSVRVTSENYIATDGVYQVTQSQSNGRPVFTNTKAFFTNFKKATLRFERVGGKDNWGANAWLNASGWIIKHAGKHRFGVATDKPISELGLLDSSWRARAGARLPLAVVCI